MLSGMEVHLHFEVCIYVLYVFLFNRFQYIDPPEERMVLEALKQLYYFGAVNR